MTRPAPVVVTSTCEVVRVRALDGRALYLMIYGLGRKARFATVAEVPFFEGDLAWFEVSPKAKTPLGVVFRGQVEKPVRPVHWSR